MNWIMVAVVAFLMGAFAFGLVQGWTSSGPNCPGMDPAWLGWCE